MSGTLIYSRFPLGDRAIPTAQQIIPPVFDAKATNELDGAVYEFEPEAEDILHELLPRNLAVQILRRCSKMPRRSSGAQMSAIG